jgi:hypothetical protein
MRKLKIYILTIVTALTPIGATAQEVAGDSLQSVAKDSIAVEGTDTVRYRVVYVHDTVYTEKPAAHSNDLIRIKGIGRFDRGIVNYRFIPKKKWIGGVTASYVNLSIDDNQLLYSLLKDVNISGQILSVKPFIGYAVRDNNVIGVKFGYNRAKGDLGNLSVAIDDLDFTMKNMLYKQDSYTVALFHRSYVGLDAAKRFGVFSETSLSYTTGTSIFSREEDSGLKRTDTDMREVRLGLDPGLEVFIMDNVSAEVSFGIVGFKYLWEEQRNNLGEYGKRHSSGANFKINLFNINIGITLCI